MSSEKLRPFCPSLNVLTHVSLFAYDMWELCVLNAGVELTAHQGCALVVFDIPQVSRLGQSNILGESLKDTRSRSAGQGQGIYQHKISGPVFY